MATLLEVAVEGLVLLDVTGSRLDYVNDAGCHILGRPREELVGLHPTQIPLPTEFSEGSAVAISGPGGREIECTVFVVTAPAGDIKAIRLRDVTDIRRQERRLKTFSRTSASIAFAESLNISLDRLADDIRLATDLEACTFFLMERDGGLRQVGTAGAYPGISDYAERLQQCRSLGAPLLSIEVFESGQPQIFEGWREMTLQDARFAPLHQINQDAAWDTLAVFPLSVRGSTVGVFNGYYLKGRQPSESDVAFLAAIADQAAVAVDNSRMLVELEKKVSLDERHRLARDLHDSVSQALFSMTLQTRAVEVLAQRDPPSNAAVLNGLSDVRELMKDTLAEMRALIFQLRPDALREEGLMSALRRQATAMQTREGIHVHVTGPAHVGLSEAVQVELFRFIGEAMNNVVQHAQASMITVSVTTGGEQDHDLVIEIRDDGTGFEPSAPRDGHLGLISMSERITQLGGTLRVLSSPGEHTTIRAEMDGLAARSTTHNLSASAAAHD